jgi:hypothetical protein
MSRHINVNPGQYKVAGRERQGEDIIHEREKEAFSKSREQKRARPRKSAAKKR